MPSSFLDACRQKSVPRVKQLLAREKPSKALIICGFKLACQLGQAGNAVFLAQTIGMRDIGVEEGFFKACKHNRYTVVDRLLPCRLTEEAIAVGFQIACGAGATKVVSVLLNQNVVFVEDQAHGLKLAVEHEQMEVVKYLLRRCSSSFTKDGIFRAFEASIKIGNMHVIRLLGKLVDGKRAARIFHKACETGSMSVVSYFYPMFALDLNDNDMDLALLVACRKGSIEMGQYLMMRANPGRLVFHQMIEIMIHLGDGHMLRSILEWIDVGDEHSQKELEDGFTLACDDGRMDCAAAILESIHDKNPLLEYAVKKDHLQLLFHTLQTGYPLVLFVENAVSKESRDAILDFFISFQPLAVGCIDDVFQFYLNPTRFNEVYQYAIERLVNAASNKEVTVCDLLLTGCTDTTICPWAVEFAFQHHRIIPMEVVEEAFDIVCDAIYAFRKRGADVYSVPPESIAISPDLENTIQMVITHLDGLSIGSYAFYESYDVKLKKAMGLKRRYKRHHTLFTF